MEEVHGKEDIRHIIEELKTEKYFRKHLRQCPGCKVPIEVSI